MSVKVKICGITSTSDAINAAESGVDLLGFMFYDRSPRHVSLSQAAEIARHLPPYIIKVGVFVNPEPELVREASGECNLNLLQFHGDESPEFCLQFGLMCMKAFRIRDAQSLKPLPAYRTHAWLLDAYVPDALGGTGATFNWDLAVEAGKMGPLVFLAGGLNPENVAAAIRKTKPYGVDASSGVETVPGKKDPAKVRAFIAAAKGAA